MGKMTSLTFECHNQGREAATASLIPTSASPILLPRAPNFAWHLAIAVFVSWRNVTSCFASACLAPLAAFSYSIRALRVFFYAFFCAISALIDSAVSFNRK
jgi:hypothetical protein